MIFKWILRIDLQLSFHYICSDCNLLFQYTEGPMAGNDRAAVAFQGVWKSFKQGRRPFVALRGLTLSVATGEIFGFLGPNGAGKSTAIKILMGFIKPDSGTASVEGLIVGRDPFQQKIGYLPEAPCFYENLTGLETLRFAARASGLSRKVAEQRAWAVLERLNLKHAGKSQIRTHSKGMKQRLGICQALIHDPEIYILDEPMSGLDPLGRRLITEVILGLKDKGKTVFFSSHILSDAERLCDRIGILNKGEMLFVGKTQEIATGQDSLEDAFVNIIESHKGGKID